MVVDTHYDILGVSQDATAEEIKHAYRRIVRTCHPDIADDPDARTHFEAVAKAYAVLSNADERSRYDRAIRIPQSVEDLFLHNARGKRIVGTVVATAPAEPKPGVHLVRVVQDAENLPDHLGLRHWGCQPGAGDPGKNGAESGDVFVFFRPKP